MLAKFDRLREMYSQKTKKTLDKFPIVNKHLAIK